MDGDEPGPEGSIDKLLMSATDQHLLTTAIGDAGPGGLAWARRPGTTATCARGPRPSSAARPRSSATSWPPGSSAWAAERPSTVGVPDGRRRCGGPRRRGRRGRGVLTGHRRHPLGDHVALHLVGPAAQADGLTGQEGLPVLARPPVGRRTGHGVGAGEVQADVGQPDRGHRRHELGERRCRRRAVARPAGPPTTRRESCPRTVPGHGPRPPAGGPGRRRPGPGLGQVDQVPSRAPTGSSPVRPPASGPAGPGRPAAHGVPFEEEQDPRRHGPALVDLAHHPVGGEHHVGEELLAEVRGPTDQPDRVRPRPPAGAGPP